MGFAVSITLSIQLGLLLFGIRGVKCESRLRRVSNDVDFLAMIPIALPTPRCQVQLGIKVRVFTILKVVSFLSFTRYHQRTCTLKANHTFKVILLLALDNFQLPLNDDYIASLQVESRMGGHGWTWILTFISAIKAKIVVGGFFFFDLLERFTHQIRNRDNVGGLYALNSFVTRRRVKRGGRNVFVNRPP